MSRKLVFALVAALLARDPARAYLREDHQMTVRAALDAARSRPPGDALIAVCAQLADEAPELNAIEVYRRLMLHPADYARWLAFGKGPVETVGRMATIQQLLHGLTGGAPEGVREAARGAIMDIDLRARALPRDSAGARADALCALGFAFHLYGDSFAHQRMKNSSKMYRTGIGHLFDSSAPDLPLYSRERFQLWGRYLDSASGLLSRESSSSLTATIAGVGPIQDQARRANGYNQSLLHALLGQLLKAEGAVSGFIPFEPAAGAGCQAIIDREAKLALTTPPDCDRAWALFRDAAIRNFDAYDVNPAHPHRSRDPELLRTPYFLGSPFSKGAGW